MIKGMSRFRQVITWPEFQVIWILLAMIAGAFVLGVIGFANPVLFIFQMGLLAAVLILAGLAVYKAALTDRDTEIERSELRSILEGLEDAVIVYDDNFKATYFNAAAEHIFKLNAKEVLGHTFAPQDVERPGWQTLIQVIFPSLAPRVTSRSREGQYPQIVDLSFADPMLEFRVTSAPITDDKSKTIAFMKIVRDRTSQILALRSRSEFVTVASHQLRGPITDVNWALESLAHAQGLSESDRAIVENAFAASQGLLRRIEGLINISKMEEGQFGYKFEESNVEDFIGKILADVLPAARKASVKIYFDRPTADLPRVMIDPSRLSLALTNILENAVRYNVENGEVTVRVEAVPGKPFVEVSVKDTGIGIPPEAMAKVFTKFYRADNAMKSETEGSGLGLYIAKTIVAAHGGEIWADSELNRGTTIHFTLPTDPNLVPKREVGMFAEF